MESANAPELSVVIPVYNEQENLPALIEELEAVLRGMKRSAEVICVDDKSGDGSVQVIQNLQATRSWLRLVRHTVNCGESGAQATGFRCARGDVVVTMDADQQNDPADIPAMLAELGPGVAAVCGIRRKREESRVRRISSCIGNGFRNFITDDRIADAGCTFRVIRRRALRDMLVFNGMHRFLPTILRLQGFTVKEQLVNHRPRTRGKSKYGVGNRMWRGIVDCLAMRWYRRRCVPCERGEPDGV